MTTRLTKAYDLTDQVALITGGAQGIGLAIGTLLAEQGARIVIVDQNPKVGEIAEALGHGSFGVAIDVRDDSAMSTGVADILAKTGRIDILVNNVGIAPIALATEFTMAQWDATLSINLRAAFMFSQAVGRGMIARKYGRIVSLASQAALVALEGHIAYTASKAAVIAMSKVLALEWGPHGITANTISPTVINTAMGREVWAGAKGDAFRAKIPVGRFGEAEEIAHAVLYLVSGAAGMINGENLVVDGGYTIV
ncbi:GolD/DthD family dehydrogenase [Acidisoma cladoniae]|jgi:NAD(P)-dependent dehydrogenase (short-subunit alcohol dehydrogenase family)|uniref:GolD/DthD family dehydrogenase n=1 Tax=Acidisoma cladoniae TaxID=3040935 RepID=UPI00254E64D6|nr:D-threitol dehydrogenase [Acidisoma sp. PAMC 29798]